MAMQMVCPQCLKEYTLGINGVMNGCDTCEGIKRSPTGLIIYDLPKDVEPFIKRINPLTEKQS